MSAPRRSAVAELLTAASAEELGGMDAAAVAEAMFLDATARSELVGMALEHFRADERGGLDYVQLQLAVTMARTEALLALLLGEHPELGERAHEAVAAAYRALLAGAHQENLAYDRDRAAEQARVAEWLGAHVKVSLGDALDALSIGRTESAFRRMSRHFRDLGRDPSERFGTGLYDFFWTRASERDGSGG